MSKKTDAVKRIKIAEAAEAVALALECSGADKPGVTVKKKDLLAQIEDWVWSLRRQSGVLKIPTVLNKEVKVADTRFCRCNWSKIREKAAEMEYFIIWNPVGEPLGIRLGSLEEYQEQQAWVMNATQGFADFHNQRAKTIREHGANAGDLDLKLKRR